MAKVTFKFSNVEYPNLAMFAYMLTQKYTTEEFTLRPVDRQRVRTIAALLSRGIKHRLVLFPTGSLFDYSKLIVVRHPDAKAWREQLGFLREYFADYRAYHVKVSAYGRAMTLVSMDTIYTLNYRKPKVRND